MEWQPSATIETLKLRAAVLDIIRHFFKSRQVWEVETPCMNSATGTDVHLEPLEVTFTGESHYLQTSPEFAMKRLLAAGSGSIFQLCKAFRDDELGKEHNPEFTMLEWYRVGFDEQQLMDEVADLVQQVQSVIQGGSRVSFQVRKLTYRDAFQQYIGLDPFSASVAELQAAAGKFTEIDLETDDKDDWLHLLMAIAIEPQLDKNTAMFIFDYPPSQAALAQVQRDTHGQEVAKRFELYLAGVELANGYLELTDAEEQLRRFQQDLAHRRAQNKTPLPQDERFLAALDAGLPACAGVALGVDRLLMALLGKSDIRQVLSFAYDRA